MATSEVEPIMCFLLYLITQGDNGKTSIMTLLAVCGYSLVYRCQNTWFHSPLCVLLSIMRCQKYRTLCAIRYPSTLSDIIPRSLASSLMFIQRYCKRRLVIIKLATTCQNRQRHTTTTLCLPRTTDSWITKQFVYGRIERSGYKIPLQFSIVPIFPYMI